MRVPAELQMHMLQAIRAVASVCPDLKDPAVERLILVICEESYRQGIVEMQEPIRKDY